jgi:hypothetical protein
MSCIEFSLEKNYGRNFTFDDKGSLQSKLVIKIADEFLASRTRRHPLFHVQELLVHAGQLEVEVEVGLLHVGGVAADVVAGRELGPILRIFFLPSFTSDAYKT